jgi:hypothetical protein
MSQHFQVDGTPNIVLVGVSDKQALLDTQARLDREKVAYYAWHEPDFNFGLTAIATEAMSKERKRFLRDYRLYNPVITWAGAEAFARPSVEAAHQCVVSLAAQSGTL